LQFYSLPFNFVIVVDVVATDVIKRRVEVVVAIDCYACEEVGWR